MGTVNCQKVRASVPSLDPLPFEQRARIKGHLDTCRACDLWFKELATNTNAENETLSSLIVEAAQKARDAHSRAPRKIPATKPRPQYIELAAMTIEWIRT